METASRKWTQVGVTAQSVVGVADEAISTSTYATDGNQYLGVRYTELIPIMIAGIQELTQLNAQLTARITALETNCF